MPLPNIQSLARFGQILSRARQPAPTLPQDMVQPFRGFNEPTEPEFNVDAEIARLYKPRTTMQDLTGQMLGNFPERDPNPSVWRRIGAFMAGMGAGMHGEDPMQAANRFQNFHYLNSLADWKAKFDPLSKAADDERLANAQELALARQTVSQKQSQQKIDLQEKKDRANIERQKFDSETRRMRAFTYDWKTRNPNMILEARGREVYGVNPQTGEATIIRDPQTGNPIPGNLFAQTELAELNNQNRLGQIREQGAQNRQTQAAGIEARGQQDWQPMNVQMPDGTTKSMLYNPATQTFKEADVPGPVSRPGTNRPGGGQSQMEQDRIIAARAQQAKIDHPEWNQFIGFGTNNRVFVKPPGRQPDGSQGPSKEVHDAIKAYLSGKVQGNLVAPGLTPPRGAQAPAAGGTTTMIGPDGKTYNIPNNMVEAAKKDGLKVK